MTTDGDLSMSNEEDNPFSNRGAHQFYKDSLKETNEFPFITEEFGKLEVNEKVDRAYLFNSPVGTYLYTLEEQRKLSVYIIKSYVAQETFQTGNGSKNYLRKSKITNFRMTKRATLELEYEPK